MYRRGKQDDLEERKEKRKEEKREHEAMIPMRDRGGDPKSESGEIR